MRLAHAFKRRAHQSDFARMPGVVEHATHFREAQPHQIGVDDIGLAVIANFRQLAVLIRAPPGRAILAQFAGEAAQFGSASNGAAPRG